MRKFLVILGAVFVGLGLTALPAHADHAQEWSANADSQIVSDTSVLLAGPNTSVETGNLNVNVDTGDTISFAYELHDGAICGAGAPRVFVAVNGFYTNSFDGNPDQCGTGGVVSFVVPNSGLITHTGIVFDQAAGYVDGSSVTVSNLTVDGEVVHFMNPDPEPTEDPDPTKDPEPDPDPKDEDPAPEPKDEQPNDDDTPAPSSKDGELPDTGGSTTPLLIGAAALGVVGAGAFGLRKILSH